MVNFAISIGLVACSFLVVRGMDKMLGPGKWTVINIMKCEEDASMLFKFEINRRKINRTHDGFNAKMNLKEDIDDTFAIRIDICKHVDGGCKPYQVLSDNSFANFVKKYAENNVREALIKADIDPPDFPVKSGNHEMKAYVFDYDELPEDCPYGEYGAKAFMLKDGLEKGCVNIHVRCYEEDERER